MTPVSCSTYPRGFTLVEVIVALAILSMIVLTTLTAFRTLVQTQTRITQQTERTEQMRMVSLFLRSSISQATPVRRELEGRSAERVTYFRGEPQELIWVAPVLRGSASTRGLQVSRLSLNEKAQLQIQFAPYISSRQLPAWEQYQAHTLLEEVTEFAIRYADMDGILQNNWPWSENSPIHLKLRLAVAGSRWPELALALPTSSEIREPAGRITFGGR